MTHEQIREYMKERGYEDALLFENPSFDDAFIGATHDGRAVYDFEKMLGCLMDGMSEEEALDCIEYNTLRSLPYYEKSPVVLFTPEDM